MYKEIYVMIDKFRQSGFNTSHHGYRSQVTGAHLQPREDPQIWENCWPTDSDQNMHLCPLQNYVSQQYVILLDNGHWQL